jgi:hypothetical protein
MLLAWSSLIKGDFEKVEQLAEGILEATSAAEEAFGLALFGLLAGIDEDYARGMQLGEASTSLLLKASATQNPITAILSHLSLAVAHSGLEEYQAAKRCIHTALKRTITLRSPAFITLCLPVAAIVLAHEVETERSIELIALAFTHPASTPTWMERWPLLTRLRADLKAELGPEVYQSIWARGRRLDLETVVTELLDELEENSTGSE